MMQLPAVRIVVARLDTLQIAGVIDEYTGLSPVLVMRSIGSTDDALEPNEIMPPGLKMVVGANGLSHVIACVPCAIKNDCSTEPAGLYERLPACDALIVHVPRESMVTLLPVTEQMPTDAAVGASVTVSEDDAVAVSASGTGRMAWFGIGENEIV